MKYSRRLNKKIKKSKIHRGGKNLFTTEESSLTNEQKFINSLYTKLLKYNPLSVINLAITHYDAKNVLSIVEDINTNPQSKSWFQGFFDSLWSCFRIYNLKHFVTDYILNELLELKIKKSKEIKRYDKKKPLMTIDELNKFIITFTELNGPLNTQAIIANSIKLYLENQQCLVHEGGNRIQNGGGWEILLVICLVLGFFFSSKGKQQDARVPFVANREDEAPEQGQGQGMGMGEAFLTYQAFQKLKGEDNVFDQGTGYFEPATRYDRDY